MLVLGRETGERVRITGPDGSFGWVKVVRTAIGTVRLGLEFPRSYQIEREELIDGGPVGADVVPPLPATEQGE